jgi:hypothetical protein
MRFLFYYILQSTANTPRADFTAAFVVQVSHNMLTLAMLALAIAQTETYQKKIFVHSYELQYILLQFDVLLHGRARWDLDAWALAAVKPISG